MGWWTFLYQRGYGYRSLLLLPGTQSFYHLLYYTFGKIVIFIWISIIETWWMLLSYFFIRFHTIFRKNTLNLFILLKSINSSLIRVIRYAHLFWRYRLNYSMITNLWSFIMSSLFFIFQHIKWGASYEAKKIKLFF